MSENRRNELSLVYSEKVSPYITHNGEYWLCVVQEWKLQNVEDTAHLSLNGRYEFSPSLCGELSAHLAHDRENSPRVVQSVKFHNALPISKEELSSHVTDNAEYWMGFIQESKLHNVQKT